MRSSEQGKNSQGTLTTEENTLATKELRMMPSCDGIRTTLTDSPSVSGHFAHWWACRSVCRDTNSLVVKASNLFNFDLYENSL